MLVEEEKKNNKLIHCEWFEIQSLLEIEYDYARGENDINRMGFLARFLEKVDFHLGE